MSRGLAAIDIVPIGSSEAALSVFFGHLGRLLSESAMRQFVCAHRQGVYSPELPMGQTRTSLNGGAMTGFSSKADSISPCPYVS